MNNRTLAETIRDDFLSMMRLLKRGESVVIEINKTNLSYTQPVLLKTS